MLYLSSRQSLVTGFPSYCLNPYLLDLSLPIFLHLQDFTVNWNYVQAVFFSTTILTTIGQCTCNLLNNWENHISHSVCMFLIIFMLTVAGYGNIAPGTFAGRLFCILFAIVSSCILYPVPSHLTPHTITPHTITPHFIKPHTPNITP